jgi:hypothetical protein
MDLIDWSLPDEGTILSSVYRNEHGEVWVALANQPEYG